MMSSVRRMSKTAVGSAIFILFLLTIAASFALQDMSNLNPMGGGSAQQLAKAGGEKLTEQELSKALQQRLTNLRNQQPTADYSALAGEFDTIVNSLIQQRALVAFAGANDVVVSKRMVDAEIAKLPQARGLDGRFSQQAYNAFLANAQMTDADVRNEIRQVILNRAVLGPAALGARVPTGVARPYAEMQLEVREADVGLIPTAPFLARVGDPTAAQLQSFYQSNVRRYTVPEQRVLNIARIGPENVAGLAATDKEIVDYYNANQATYGSKTQRVISQVVLPAKATADQLAAKLRAGTSFVDAARPLGYSATDISVGPQTQDQFAGLTSAEVAKAAFAANAPNAIVGPIRSDLGWHVIKIDGIQQIGGKSLAAARAEIATKLTADKRKNALADLVANVEDAVADGRNFREAASASKLAIVTTPPITAGGVARSNPAFKLPADLAPVVRAGFDLGQDDEPVVETLPNDAGYALVGVDSIIPSAPALLAQIRAQVVADWKQKQASDRAKAIANDVAAKVSKGMALGEAIRSANAGIALPAPEQTKVRRIQLAQMGGNVPPALAMMFSLAQGRSRMVADPQGRGFIIVKVTRIIPGDVTLQPGLVAQLQSEFAQPLQSEYAEQFARAMAADVGVKRDDEAIEAARKRIVGGGAAN